MEKGEVRPGTGVSRRGRRGYVTEGVDGPAGVVEDHSACLGLTWGECRRRRSRSVGRGTERARGRVGTPTHDSWVDRTWELFPGVLVRLPRRQDR